MMGFHIDYICLKIFGLRVTALIPSVYVKNLSSSMSIKTWRWLNFALLPPILFMDIVSFLCSRMWNFVDFYFC